MLKAKNIVTEWFYRLEKGYAAYPFSEHELSVLKEVLQQNNIQNPDPLIEFFTEKVAQHTAQPHDKEDPEVAPEREPETHESNEDFRNLLDSYEQFTEIINRRYLTPGIQVEGLDKLYTKLKELPDSLNLQMRRLIGKRTNRDLPEGTFKMGQHEKLLHDLISETIRIPNIHSSVFWFAIIQDGKVKPRSGGDSIETGNVFIDESNVLIRNFTNEVIQLGPVSAEIASLLTILVNLGEVIDGSKIEDYTKQAINSLLDKLSDEANRQELEQFLNMSNVTRLSALKSLSNNIKTALENHNLEELPVKFCTLVDQHMAKVLTDIAYWGTIHGDMVYLTPGSSLYPALNCTKEHKLGGGIFAMNDMKLSILGNVVADKLM